MSYCLINLNELGYEPDVIEWYVTYCQTNCQKKVDFLLLKNLSYVGLLYNMTNILIAVDEAEARTANGNGAGESIVYYLIFNA